MQIKTIRRRLDNAEAFDEEVNKALSEGWSLTKRYLLKGGNLSSTAYCHSMLIAEMVKDVPPDTLEIEVKYFDKGIEQIQKISVGDWIDLRSADRVELKAGEYKLLRLGVGMILPNGYEALVLPRSSTPGYFGIMCANSMSVIDNSYSGDADEWRFPAVAIRDTVINKGDRIAQFRIIKNQPSISFETVEHLNENSRGGIGSTGAR